MIHCSDIVPTTTDTYLHTFSTLKHANTIIELQYFTKNSKKHKIISNNKSLYTYLH